MSQVRPLQSHPQRLQKALAHAGVGSRRSIENLIRGGRVSVNGQPAILGQKVGARDQVLVDGQLVSLRPEGLAYYALHKPAGVITSVRDELGRRTVMDLATVPERVYPVGRLDADSEGLVLLTNDGELAHRLTHPRHSVPKVYQVWLRGKVTPSAVSRLLQGVTLDDGPARAERVEVLRVGQESSVLRLTLKEGRKRQVRRMCEVIGHPVERLRRIAIGPLRLGDLSPGRWRRLSPSEVRVLRQQVGLPHV
ncbi:MAG: rRNA pseudouridine synthase [Anaerolineae bacterium]|nr:rRNA pseudouridine synthase [Anaerolineae bacterium]